MSIISRIVFALALVSASYSGATAKIKGSVKVDGSSTVFPITEAIAEEFGKKEPGVRVVVGSSGTGGGFKKFVLGEIDINDASRTIKESEAKSAKEHGVSYLELPVAHDGITVVVNTANDWVDHLTAKELTKIWEPNSKVKTWKDIRSNWPNRKIKLYGPGTDSGTFDFFTEAVNGKSQLSRSDFTKSEDDNVLVQGVSGDKDSLGFFGYAYYASNESRLRAIPIDGGKGPIMPSPKTINDETYTPLSRIVYIYVADKSMKRPEVKEFVKFYLDKAGELSKEVGYIPLSDDKYNAAKAKIKKAIQ